MAAPSIVTVSPGDGSSGVALSSTIQILFDRIIDRSTIINGGIFIEGPESDRWSGPDQAYWDSPGQTFDDDVLESAGYDGIIKGKFTFEAVGGSAQAEETIITLPALAVASDGDYVVLYDITGAAWAVALDTTGTAAQAPTGPVWAAIPAANKVYVDISTTATAADVGAIVFSAFQGLSGFNSQFGLTNNFDGTLLAIVGSTGPCTDAAVYSFDDSGAGSITVTISVQGQDQIVETNSANETTWQTRAIFEPEIYLAPGVQYRVWIIGEEDSSADMRAGISTRTVYDTLVVNQPASTGIVKFDGGYDGVTSDTYHVRIEETGKAEDSLLVSTWKASDPIGSLKQLRTRLSSQLIENGLTVIFDGSFDALDEFSVEVVPPQRKIATETITFTTGSGNITPVSPDTSVPICTTGSSSGGSTGAASFKIISIEPAERSTNLPLEDCRIITVTFNMDVDPNTVTGDTVRVWTEPVNGSFDGQDIVADGVLGKVLTVSGNKITIQLY